MYSASAIALSILALLAAPRADAAGHPPFSEMKGNCSNYHQKLSEEFRLWTYGEKQTSSELEPTDNAPEIEVNKKSLVQLQESDAAPSSNKEFHSRYKGSYGGFVKFRPPHSGQFLVSAGGKAWIEILDPKKGEIYASSFEMQTACKTIYKVTSFHLDKSRDYFIGILGAEGERFSLLVTPSQAGK